jgi:hypothetical protein
MPTPMICLMCASWEEGLCENPASPEYNSSDVDAGRTCPYWEGLEVLDVCQTCSYWVMYRRERTCNNPNTDEYGLPTKSHDSCGGGWKEKLSLKTPIRRPSS